MRGIPRAVRALIAVLMVVIALSVVISATSGDRAGLTLPEKILRSIFSPIGNFFWNIGRGASDFFGGLFRLGSIMDENRRLKEEVEALKSNVAQISGLEAENARLSGLLDLKKQFKGKTVAAKVVYRDFGNWLGTVVIDRGSADGIKPGMAVINSLGIVGRVVASTSGTASILLANDPRNAIGAVTVRSRDFAIAEGVGDGTGVLRLKPFGAAPDIKPGDLVVSSGLGGVYPAGHIIGEVVDVDEGAYGMAKVAYVRSAVDFSRVEEVLVLVDSQKGNLK